jgi:hypothetical protein
MKRLILAIGSSAIFMAAMAGAAVAAPGPTPNGWVGACNMMQDATMMTIPMVRNLQGNGNDGMHRAVAVSGGCE